MSLFRKLLSALGFNQVSEKEQLEYELSVLHNLMILSLQLPVNIDELAPNKVLEHTGKIKNLLLSLSKKGMIPKNIVSYIISNISSQESMISNMWLGYNLDPSIYASQVGASLGEVLKDLALIQPYLRK